MSFLWNNTPVKDSSSTSSSSVSIPGTEKPLLPMLQSAAKDNKNEKENLGMTASKLSIPRLMRGGKKSSIGGHDHQVITMSVMLGGFTIGTNASGILTSSYGWGSLIASPDWSSLAALFEMVRVTRIRADYQPRAPSQFVTSVTCVHTPAFWSYDPIVNTGIPFSTMVQTRPLSDERNVYTNTSRSKTHVFHVDQKVVGNSSGAAALLTLGEWQPTSATASQGVMLISTLTESSNVSLVYGILAVEFECEFGYRV
jgi:hypothetical protein